MNWLIIAVFIVLALSLGIFFRLLQNLLKAALYTFLLFILLMVLGTFYAAVSFQIGEDKILVLHMSEGELKEGITLEPSSPMFARLFPDFSKGEELNEEEIHEIASKDMQQLLDEYHQVLVFENLNRTDLHFGSDLELMRDTQKFFLLRQFKEGTLKIYPETFSQKVVESLPDFILKKTVFRGEIG